ncbi:funZ protein, partial [bacterium]|nr:funZ protein [bacterium]
CVKGLSNAVWNLNNDFFPSIRDSKGRFRVILLLRPDIFNSIGLQNLTNKVRDNSVFLDWRTTYPSYRTSDIFELSDKLLSAQQDMAMTIGEAWDYYFPWESASTSPMRPVDPSIIRFLRMSYSRPRDIVTIMQIMQDEFIQKHRKPTQVFFEKDIEHKDFLNKYSEYLMGGIKDQLSFYYNEKDYEMFLRFFTFLSGKYQFDYDEYVDAYNKFTEFILNNHDEIPEFVETPDKFIQFLYDTNIICYIEDIDSEPLFRWCYRERNPSDISPKVKIDQRYRIHYGLHKALNIGAQKYRKKV